MPKCIYSLITPDALVVVVLAGLGSAKILSILKEMPQDWYSSQLRIVCLPHTCPLKLMDWMKSQRVPLVRERYFEDRGRIYPVLLFSAGFTYYPDEENEELSELSKKYWDNYARWLKKTPQRALDPLTSRWLSEYTLNKDTVT
ncbi:SAM-dependent methyltransferase family protein [Candidatus Mycoplasma haematolamae str. Purdue]|uniref:SAM-dependent methyltransferase family protein n=1 Tax=Mycoplasma haematolamae (strain Purdue) TaxID=1212765 RepID=I7CIT5_MYCHA|nr:SAM-dependent methyltransferase family protein [Candidatus Mycoplasma haematolamae str. Purdue]